MTWKFSFWSFLFCNSDEKKFKSRCEFNRSTYLIFCWNWIFDSFPFFFYRYILCSLWIVSILILPTSVELNFCFQIKVTHQIEGCAIIFFYTHVVFSRLSMNWLISKQVNRYLLKTEKNPELNINHINYWKNWKHENCYFCLDLLGYKIADENIPETTSVLLVQIPLFRMRSHFTTGIFRTSLFEYDFLFQNLFTALITFGKRWPNYINTSIDSIFLCQRCFCLHLCCKSHYVP